MTLGEYVLNYRTEHKESLRSFARRAELSPTYVSYLEKGETQRGKKPIASIETYRSIAIATGVTLNSLIRIVDDDVALNSSGTLSAKAQLAEIDDMEAEFQAQLAKSRNRAVISPEKQRLLDAVDGMDREQLIHLLNLIESIKRK